LAAEPSISILLVGYNEEKSIENAIRSLLEFNYENMEIIVVDDGSTDRMYEKAKPYADRGLIKLFRNSAASGRAGRPAASNMALSLSSGEYIISVDADTSFDRDTIINMIGPFYEPQVGVVAGNLKVRNGSVSFWSRMQGLEYFQSISLWKRWLNVLGTNMQASGAFGAFRRQVLEDCGAWDPELAEDADLSLKIKKSGWRVAFAPYAIAMTNVPETLGQLMKQRYRWDRGMLRTYFHKHGNLMFFWRFDWRNALQMGIDFFFSIVLTYAYVFWLGFMLWRHPLLLLFIYPIAYAVYAVTSFLTIGVPILFSERRREEWSLIFWTPFYPFYKGLLRWVRLYALILETFRVNYEEPYLPESAWRNTPRW
jgi:cellulose synthase/poly-beta-1,6-N-acetylglucosamine synthase-like glycosyltransferase